MEAREKMKPGLKMDQRSIRSKDRDLPLSYDRNLSRELLVEQ